MAENRRIRAKADSRETGRIGKRGTLVIPARLRRRFGIEEGALVVVEARDDGVLIRPAVALPLEVYSPRRRAEFLLNNAASPAGYRLARRAVRKMGLDPDAIPHERLAGA